MKRLNRLIGAMRSPLYKKIYTVVAHIPVGTVATYGQVARLAGLAGHARMVGYALHALPEDVDVPWQRVVNAKGYISLRGDSDWADHQRIILESEGIRFDSKGRIALQEFQWRPTHSAFELHDGPIHDS